MQKIKKMHLKSESLAPCSLLSTPLPTANLHHRDHNDVPQRQLQSLENRGTEGGRSTRMGPTMSLGQFHVHVQLLLLLALLLLPRQQRHVHLNLQLLEGQLDWYRCRASWEWICDCHVRKLHSTRTGEN